MPVLTPLKCSKPCCRFIYYYSHPKSRKHSLDVRQPQTETDAMLEDHVMLDKNPRNNAALFESKYGRVDHAREPGTPRHCNFCHIPFQLPASTVACHGSEFIKERNHHYTSWYVKVTKNPVSFCHYVSDGDSQT